MKRDIIDLRPRGEPALELLPSLVREIAEVVGVEAALKVVEAKGGTRTHFPGSVADDHWLVLAVGRAAADKLCRHFRVHNGGVSLDVPKGRAIQKFRVRQRARDLRAEGLSVRDTALRLGVTERTVYKWGARNS